MNRERKAQLTASERDWIRECFDYTCHYCGRRGGLERDPDGNWWTVDHKIPRRLGGANEEDNLVLACWCCNAAKRDMPYAEFIERCLDGVHQVGIPTVVPAPSRAVREAWRHRIDRAAAEYMGAINRGDEARAAELVAVLQSSLGEAKS